MSSATTARPKKTSREAKRDGQPETRPRAAGGATSASSGSYWANAELAERDGDPGDDERRQDGSVDRTTSRTAQVAAATSVKAIEERLAPPELVGEHAGERHRHEHEQDDDELRHATYQSGRSRSSMTHVRKKRTTSRNEKTE